MPGARILRRIPIGLIAGAATYGGLRLFDSWGLADPARIGIAAAVGVLGMVVGPRIWQVVVELF